MHLDAIFLVPELHVILLFRPKFANYRKVSSPPHLLPISHFHCQVFSQTTFLVAETKFVKMWYRGEERCFKRRHSGRYNQMKCLLQIHLPTSLWLTSQIGFEMRGSCGSLQQCINIILQRFGNMIQCFFITTYLMFFVQLLKIENFQTKLRCFQLWHYPIPWEIDITFTVMKHWILFHNKIYEDKKYSLKLACVLHLHTTYYIYYTSSIYTRSSAAGLEPPPPELCTVQRMYISLLNIGLMGEIDIK